jgi:hypothetical protein
MGSYRGGHVLWQTHALWGAPVTILVARCPELNIESSLATGEFPGRRDRVEELRQGR